MIDITGIDKADLLAALYNRASPLGMGDLQFDSTPMSRAEAQELLDKAQAEQWNRFDYVKGRPLKIDLRELLGKALDERLYERDQGRGSVAAVVAALRRNAAKRSSTG